MENGRSEMPPENEKPKDAEDATGQIAFLADRDQNDSEVQDIARQVGVFCRGLDEAGVEHTYIECNKDRQDAVQFFILTEMGRLRGRQDRENEIED